jgi:hypothetical protein
MTADYDVRSLLEKIICECILQIGGLGIELIAPGHKDEIISAPLLLATVISEEIRS